MKSVTSLQPSKSSNLTQANKVFVAGIGGAEGLGCIDYTGLL